MSGWEGGERKNKGRSRQGKEGRSQEKEQTLRRLGKSDLGGKKKGSRSTRREGVSARRDRMGKAGSKKKFRKHFAAAGI